MPILPNGTGSLIMYERIAMHLEAQHTNLALVLHRGCRSANCRPWIRLEGKLPCLALFLTHAQRGTRCRPMAPFALSICRPPK
ncbi:hypothetical protein DUNSADRAFT_18156 [Dunaliella salina]|uniref:Encoded protein n=1 Tax=Dunaliella salina TaxID=3046 RepID=A0ABQ7GZF9_DUNSA|nr:hypothetical protein DUNSADRAFT_18156 [Dunaliella salina]|eukprot:KAF5839996.1 hypothetical protein DUNSADRAFT_18156 [Dunaliella salina]